MQGKEFMIVIFSFFLILFGGSDFSYSQTSGAPPPKVTDIGTWTQLPPGHPQINLKDTCMACHNYVIDATTTATKQMVRNGKRMEKETLWKYIVELLGGGKRTKTMVLASSLHDMPIATVCGQMIDPVNKVLYAFYEIGTEKLEQIKENPRVCLTWNEPWPDDFSKVLGIQVTGVAKLFDGSSPEFAEGFKIYFPSEEVVRTYAAATLQEFLLKMKKNMIMSKITIDQIILFDGTLLKEGFCAYQMWRREDNVSPSSYIIK